MIVVFKSGYVGGVIEFHPGKQFKNSYSANYYPESIGSAK